MMDIPREVRLPATAITLRPNVAGDFTTLSGFANPERTGRWTGGPRAEMAFALPPAAGGCMVILTYRPFVWPRKQLQQHVTISAGGQVIAEWTLSSPGLRKRALFIPPEARTDPGQMSLSFDIPTCCAPASLDINGDKRELGLLIQALTWFEVPQRPDPASGLWLLGRPVGPESRKTYDAKLENGFWSRYITGDNVLDIGFRGGAADALPLMPGAIGVDLDYPGYDGRTLPFADGSQDAVHVSHCLEHIPNHIRAIQEWHRVVKVGGHIIIGVPHAHLYERRRRPPSQWNIDHQRFYTPASLLAEIEAALAPNSYRVRFLEDRDEGYLYTLSPDTHPAGCYEITLVLEKVTPPEWRVAD